MEALGDSSGVSKELVAKRTSHACRYRLFLNPHHLACHHLREHHHLPFGSLTVTLALSFVSRAPHGACNQDPTNHETSLFFSEKRTTTITSKKRLGLVINDFKEFIFGSGFVFGGRKKGIKEGYY